jgi:hypothetical protein
LSSDSCWGSGNCDLAVNTNAGGTNDGNYRAICLAQAFVFQLIAATNDGDAGCASDSQVTANYNAAVAASLDDCRGQCETRNCKFMQFHNSKWCALFETCPLTRPASDYGSPAQVFQTSTSQASGCSWLTAVTISDQRCSVARWGEEGPHSNSSLKEFAKVGGSRITAQQRCDADVHCLGLMWYNNNGGDGRADSLGWYQGCGGQTSGSTNVDWNIILKPNCTATALMQSNSIVGGQSEQENGNKEHLLSSRASHRPKGALLEKKLEETTDDKTCV